MEYRIDTIEEKKLVGKRMLMSLNEHKTPVLWRSFMMERMGIKNAIGTDLYSMQIYPPLYFEPFNPDTVFEKWATVEVKDLDSVPEGMEGFILPRGLYVVFLYKGSPSEGAKAFEYIFGTWMPKSEYLLDDRPHFEILRDKYKNNDPSSEEEIWIPIKMKH